MLGKLFNRNKNKVSGEIKAIQSGKVIDITNIKDGMFSKKTVGDGVAFLPEGGEIYSPVTGVVKAVATTLHAYGILSDDGVEILIHIGLETVELQGEGFISKVKIGDKVNVGDLIAVVDLNLLEERGYDKATALIITNLDRVKDIDKFTGNAVKKQTAVIKYVK